MFILIYIFDLDYVFSKGNYRVGGGGDLVGVVFLVIFIFLREMYLSVRD